MNTIQVPLFETELKELQGKIHCLKFDIRQDIISLKSRHKKEPGSSSYQYSQRKFTRTELTEELESWCRVMLTRVDYYFEKWIDKQDMEEASKDHLFSNAVKEIMETKQ